MSKKVYEAPIVDITEFNSSSITSVAVSAVQSSYTKISKSKLGNNNAIDF